jgi:hypothetical protein
VLAGLLQFLSPQPALDIPIMGPQLQFATRLTPPARAVVFRAPVLQMALHRFLSLSPAADTMTELLLLPIAPILQAAPAQVLQARVKPAALPRFPLMPVALATWQVAKIARL